VYVLRSTSTKEREWSILLPGQLGYLAGSVVSSPAAYEAGVQPHLDRCVFSPRNLAAVESTFHVRELMTLAGIVVRHYTLTAVLLQKVVRRWPCFLIGFGSSAYNVCETSE